MTAGHAGQLDSDQVRAWYWDEGLSIREIAHRAGFSYTSVRRFMDQMGIPRREPGSNPLPVKPRRVTAPEAAAIRAVFTADPAAGIEKVARQFNRSPNTVRRIMNGQVGRNHRMASDVARLSELYGRGLRGVEIDRELGWRPGRASSLQRQLGLDSTRSALSPRYLEELLAKAGSLQALAKLTGIDPAHLRAAIEAAGIQNLPHPSSAAPLDRHREDLRRAYVDDRISKAKLAQRYDVTVPVMSRFLESHGIARTPRLSDAEHQRIHDLSADGMEVSAIAKKIGRPPTTVKWHLTHPQRRRRREPAAEARNRTVKARQELREACSSFGADTSPAIRREAAAILHSQGWPYWEIGALFHVRAPTIRMTLRGYQFAASDADPVPAIKKLAALAEQERKKRQALREAAEQPAQAARETSGHREQAGNARPSAGLSLPRTS